MAVELDRHGPDPSLGDVLDRRILEIVSRRLHHVHPADHRWFPGRDEVPASLIERQDGSGTREMTVPVSFLDLGNLARGDVFVRGVARTTEPLPAASRPNCAAVIPDGAAAVQLKRHSSISLILARMRSMSAASNSLRRPMGM